MAEPEVVVPVGGIGRHLDNDSPNYEFAPGLLLAVALAYDSLAGPDSVRDAGGVLSPDFTRMRPRLAVGWREEENGDWLVDLRPGLASHTGNEWTAQDVAWGFEKAAAQVTNLLHSHFKPEFLNRVDDIIVFHPLGKEQLVKIVELRLEDLRRLLAERKISLELIDGAKELLFTEGYDPNFGARPLKRAIQKLVQDPLALKILDGEVLHGDHLVMDADKKAGKMTFKVSKRLGEKVGAKG